ncbi:hypothetical protein WR25_16103 [Diploscapter pachys]|uniref:Uncharacterized protein n=1 Tax=Diploscapter pachys TaxID=2018661 RepID=A0A2A2K749_9BILA|nr:hypothetical protein WR25_16103 [Diploscapter pachys]
MAIRKTVIGFPAGPRSTVKRPSGSSRPIPSRSKPTQTRPAWSTAIRLIAARGMPCARPQKRQRPAGSRRPRLPRVSPVHRLPNRSAAIVAIALSGKAGVDMREKARTGRFTHVPILADYRDADAGGGQCFTLNIRNPLIHASVEGGERPVVDVTPLRVRYCGPIGQ